MDDKPFNFGDFFSGLANNAADVAKGYLAPKPRNAPAPQQVTQPPPADTSWIKYVAIGGGALVLLLVAGLAFGRK